MQDLTRIKGIGSSRQKWLREKLGVMSYAQLATLTVDEIEAQLKASGQIASTDTIERWIAEAGSLAITESGSGNLTVDRSLVYSPLSDRQAVSEKSGWEALAQFLIYIEQRPGPDDIMQLRTKAHHLEGDQEIIWPGIELEQLTTWMLAQINGQKQDLPAAEEFIPDSSDENQSLQASPTAQAVETWPCIHIVKIQFYQPADMRVPCGIGRPWEPFTTVLQKGKPFTLEASLELSGHVPDRNPPAETLYRIAFYIQEYGKKNSILLGEIPAYPARFSPMQYTARLKGVVLDEGRYQLQAVANTDQATIPPSYFFLPHLMVR